MSTKCAVYCEGVASQLMAQRTTTPTKKYNSQTIALLGIQLKISVSFCPLALEMSIYMLFFFPVGAAAATFFLNERTNTGLMKY